MEYHKPIKIKIPAKIQIWGCWIFLVPIMFIFILNHSTISHYYHFQEPIAIVAIIALVIMIGYYWDPKEILIFQDYIIIKAFKGLAIKNKKFIKNEIESFDFKIEIANRGKTPLPSIYYKIEIKQNNAQKEVFENEIDTLFRLFPWDFILDIYKQKDLIPNFNFSPSGEFSGIICEEIISLDKFNKIPFYLKIKHAKITKSIISIFWFILYIVIFLFVVCSIFLIEKII